MHVSAARSKNGLRKVFMLHALHQVGALSVFEAAHVGSARWWRTTGLSTIKNMQFVGRA